jgi:hypothetical protein
MFPWELPVAQAPVAAVADRDPGAQEAPQCLRRPHGSPKEGYRCPGPAPLIVTCHFSLLTYHSLIGAVSSVVERLVYTQ